MAIKGTITRKISYIAHTPKYKIMRSIHCNLLKLSLLAIIPFALTLSAEADLLVITNPSFEDPVTNGGTFSGATNSAPAGWTVYNTGATSSERYFGVWNPSTTNTFPGGAPAGVNVGVIFLENTTNLAEAGLQQTLGDTLQLNTTYTLTIEVGNFADDNATDSFDFAGFPGYRIDLMAGSNTLASDLNTLTPGEGIFETSVVSFTTGSSHTDAGQALAIRLVNLNGPGIEVNYDDVRLDASPVPEPSTTALLLGAVGLIYASRKRKRTC
jgi:hypothetical protein